MMTLDLPEQALVRWRADPEKIRVSVRRKEIVEDLVLKSVLHVRIYVRGSFPDTHDQLIGESTHPNPQIALEEALTEAEGYEGIDMHMQWAYEHPWKKRDEE